MCKLNGIPSISCLQVHNTYVVLLSDWLPHPGSTHCAQLLACTHFGLFTAAARSLWVCIGTARLGYFEEGALSIRAQTG